MSTIVVDCPHCGAKNSTFIVHGNTLNPVRKDRWSVFSTCSSCHLPICTTHGLNPNGNGLEPAQFPGNLMAKNCPHIFYDIYPRPLLVEMPEAIPEGVAKAFRQAAESRKAKHFDAACGMYRRSMELGLKAFSPDVEAWKLEKRIDKMAAESKITKELQEWAHELRLDGNDALHGDGEATEEMTDQMHSLCKFLLTYLYTLPKQVDVARERRGAA